MATHPGQVLRDGFLVPLGITPAALARGLGAQRSSVSRLLAGRADLTPALAARLGRYFGVPARWFLDLRVLARCGAARQPPPPRSASPTRSCAPTRPQPRPRPARYGR